MSKKTKKPEPIAEDEVTPPLGTALGEALSDVPSPQGQPAPVQHETLLAPAPAMSCSASKADKACTLRAGHAGLHHHVPPEGVIDAIVSWA